MANEGATTVGSIVGKLRLDRAEWKADVAKTKEEARDLGNLRPDIHIDDNASTVIARMKAAQAAIQAAGDAQDRTNRRTAASTLTVAQAEKQLTAAHAAAAVATEAIHEAQERLNEARAEGTFDAARASVAEASLAEWTKRLEHANDLATQSELELAAAQNAQAAAARRAEAANGANISRVGAITTAVALLVPLLTPVAAATIGITGAFAGMGAAGITAIFGINQELKKGSDTGQEYRTELDSMKGSLSTLAQTSAVAMLASFRRVVAETNAAMPALNTQVGRFSGLMGESGANVYAGGINVLQVLNPLLLTAAVYVRTLTERFEQWTNGPGLEQFGGYALGVLPRVTDLLASMSSAIMHILEALAPLGTIGLTALTGVADAINGIPIDVLTTLITSITWGAIAFKGWQFIAPMILGIKDAMAMLSGAAAVSTGAVGWVIAGLGALAGVLAVVISSHSRATASIQDYTAAVEQDNGAIKENVRLTAAKKLQDDGALDAAKKLGITTQTLVNATLNNVNAQAAVNRVLADSEGDYDKVSAAAARAGMSYMDYKTATNAVRNGMRDNQQAIGDTINAYNDLHGSLNENTTATQAQQRADEGVAAALGISVGALQAARASQDGMKDATAKTTAEMWLQGDAAGLLRQALDQLNGKSLSAAEAQNQFESQLTRLPEFADGAAASIDGMSQAAVDNRGSLLDMIRSAENATVALRDTGASSDDVAAKFAETRQQIIDNAEAHGMNRDAVTRYIDELYKIPAVVPKTKAELDAEEAVRVAQGYKDLLRSIPQTISVAVQMHGVENLATTGGLKLAYANGGTIRGLAGGSTGGTVTGPGTAGSDTAGLYRLARGEEVVGNVFGQADRNRTLLKQINAGFTPSPAASHAAPTATTTKEAPVININVTGTNQEDPRVLSMIIGGEVKRAMVGLL